MYQCPITYFTENLIFTCDKSAWAVFKLTGFDYDFLDDDNKIKILYKTARFLSSVTGEAQILLMPIERDNKEHFYALRKSLYRKDPLYESAVFHANETEKYLRQFVKSHGDVNDYSTYILVRLEEKGDYELFSDVKQGIQYFIKDPVNAVNVFMNLDTRDLLESRLNRCREMSEKWFFSQNKKMKLAEVEGEEVQWLLRRCMFRGIAQKNRLFYENTKREAWRPAAEKMRAGNGDIIYKPLSRDVVNLFSGSIHQGNRYLKIVQGKEAASYQTFLVLTHIPEVLEYPGNEWLYALQQLNLQGEICIHIKAKEYREALRKIENKRQEINSQMEHIAEANADIPDDLEEGKEYADILEAEIKGQRAPILETSVTICISADNLEELEQKAVTVKGIYEDWSFGVERPLADQLKLFMQCIPGAGLLSKEYMMPLTPMTLAGGVLGATHDLGDHQGPYIGTTGPEEKPVFLDLGRACLLNKSASATFYGNLGVGKSFNANLLLFLTVLYGGYGLVFDPKGERGHWQEALTMFKGMVSTVTLSSDNSNQGKLDPYNLYPEHLDEADELALNVISELLKIAPASEEYTAILEAQRMMRRELVPSMMKLIEILRSFPDTDELSKCARFLARRLGLQAGSGMSKLLFGDGSEEAINLKRRLSILQIENLKMPSPNVPKEQYTNEEMQSTVLMAVASHFAKKFALEKRDVFSLILFDESWILGKTAEGVKLFDFLSRMGRSLYTGCIFNGHSVTDIPSEGIENTISYKFCFQTNSDSEAARMCHYMGLEPTQENKETLKNLKNGECLFQDLDKHIGVLHFDAVFEDLIHVFSTTPKSRSHKQAEPAYEEGGGWKSSNESQENKETEPREIQAGENLKPERNQASEENTKPEENTRPGQKGSAKKVEEAESEEALELEFDFDLEELMKKETL